MDRELRAMLFTVLSAPDDLTPRLVLADWLEERGDPRAEAVRRHCETGAVHLRDGMLNEGPVQGQQQPSVTFLTLQLVPQSFAVEFGCRCAEHVVPGVRPEWRDDDRPLQLLAAVRDWLKGRALKKRVRQLADAMDELAAHEVRDNFAPSGRPTRPERAYYAAVSAFLLANAVLAPAGGDRWVHGVCGGIECAEWATRHRTQERAWQRQLLAELLRS